MQNLHKIIQLVFWPRFTHLRFPQNSVKVKGWAIDLFLFLILFVSLSLFPLSCFLAHFSRVRMTDGGQQNRVSGIIPPTNGCGLLGQALDRTEINISPFKIYQKRIFESASCLHSLPPTTHHLPLPPPLHPAMPQTLNQTLCSYN